MKSAAESASGVVDAYPSPIVRTPIPLRRSRAESLLGIDVPFDRMVESLRLLGFAVEPYRDTEELLAVAPSYRVDVTIEEDLVEEVARVIGYDTIPSTLPPWGGAGAFLAGESRRRQVRAALVGMGFDEAISLSFVEAELDELFDGAPDARVDVLNPVLDHKPRMRGSVLTGLVEAFETNLKTSSASCADVTMAPPPSSASYEDEVAPECSSDSDCSGCSRCSSGSCSPCTVSPRTGACMC